MQSLLAVVLLGTTVHNAIAQEREWWFDVELIVFKRDVSPSEVQEQFAPQLSFVNSDNQIELLKPYLFPDLSGLRAQLPNCLAPPEENDNPLNLQIDESLFAPIVLDGLPSDQTMLDPDAATALDPSEHVNSTTPSVPVGTLQQQQNENLSKLLMRLDEVKLYQWDDSQLIADHSCTLATDGEFIPFVESVPQKIDGNEQPSLRAPQLLSYDSLELKELARDVGRQRGLTTLIHMGWRQQTLFGRDNAKALHLFAGKNYANQFAKSGLALPPETDSSFTLEDIYAPPPSGDSAADEFTISQTEDQSGSLINLLDRIELALKNDQWVPGELISAQQKSPADLEKLPFLWELDGNIKIFLRYIQNTPYLHIDSDLNYRAPVYDKTAYVDYDTDAGLNLPDRLQSFPFDQLRRVISQQIHYFDHPMFGLIIQIRRYEFPENQQQSAD